MTRWSGEVPELSTADWILSVALAPPALVTLVALLHAIGNLLRVGSLEDVDAADAEDATRISVVIAARDEQDDIEATLRSLLACGGDELELVLVDDRSSDETGARARRIATEDGRLRVIRVDELPPGWLGKVHALRAGVGAATGEFLLFTDADVRFAPDALRRAVGYARRRELDHLAVVPHLAPTRPLLDATLAASLRNFALTVPLWRVSDPRSRTHMGVGGFNLVHRRVVEEDDPFEWLRMEPIDDIGLARRIKERGGRSDALAGRSAVGLTWYGSVGGMARGLEKNLFGAVAGYSALRWVAALLAMTWIFVAPLAVLVAPGVGMPVRALAAASVLFSMAAAGVMERWTGRPARHALLTPIGDVLLVWMTARAGWLALRRGGILWRDTLYPLDELRRLRRVRWR